ncbi:PaaI family thioesterase [Aquisediminimonas sediminicola]|uniref:PaaI family thioesterase n=1 Tax=Alteraquisediminimonas sediminicola TaxID=2676787 RepID=UPI001C8E58F7|nr:PaaI family thioesterase [Aquisediminimonas sediminicola]
MADDIRASQTERDLILGATDPDFERVVRWLLGHGHGLAIGTEYIGHGEDWVELGLCQRPDLVADPATGVIASGPIITLLDFATSASTWLRRKKVAPNATLDLRIDYLRPARPGAKIVARGECYAAKRTVSFVRGIAHDGDPEDPIAHCVGTFFNMDEKSSV